MLRQLSFNNYIRDLSELDSPREVTSQFFSNNYSRDLSERASTGAVYATLARGGRGYLQEEEVIKKFRYYLNREQENLSTSSVEPIHTQ